MRGLSLALSVGCQGGRCPRPGSRETALQKQDSQRPGGLSLARQASLSQITLSLVCPDSSLQGTDAAAFPLYSLLAVHLKVRQSRATERVCHRPSSSPTGCPVCPECRACIVPGTWRGSSLVIALPKVLALRAIAGIACGPFCSAVSLSVVEGRCLLSRLSG